MLNLEGMVQRIERKDYQPGNASHFIYDPSKESFRPDIPRFFARQLHYYQIVCSPTASPDASGKLGPIGVQDPADGTQLLIQVDYEVWIRPENALEVVRAVAGDRPGQRLTQLVIDALQRRASTTAATFFPQFPGRAADIARELEQHLLRQHGLSIRLTLQLVGASSTGLVDLPPIDLDVPVHLLDHATALTLRLGVITSVLERDQARAIDAMKRRPHLKEALRTACREFFIDIPLPRFRADLLGSLQQELRGRLERVLAQWFLRLRSLSLTLLDKLPDMVSFVEEESAFTIELRNYPRPVNLRTRLQLELKDENQYHRAGDPLLKNWVEGNVRPTVQRVLFGVSYSRLCIEFPCWEALILQGLRTAAKAIGYNVEAQITTPELPERRFQREFPLIVSGQFSTAVDTVKTGLELVLRLCLDDLRSVADELDGGVDLGKLFHDVVRDETAACLHSMQPGFLFTRFSRPADHTGKPVEAGRAIQDDRPPVEEVLRQRINKELESRYGLRLIDFIVKQGSSSIRDAYLALTRCTSIAFEVGVPLRGHGEPLLHHGELQVHGVAEEGWPQFQSKLPTPEDVTRFVTAAARDLISKHLRSASSTGLAEEEVSTIIHGELPKRMRTQLGLSINVVAWYRESSGLEKARWRHEDALHQEWIESQARSIRKKREETEAQVRELRQRAKKQRMMAQYEEADELEKQAASLSASVDGPPELPGAELPRIATRSSKPRDVGNGGAPTPPQMPPPSATKVESDHSDEAPGPSNRDPHS